MITDKQEMFNAAYIGIAKQNWRRSARASGDCLYRGPNGTKCAIGHCMTDEEAAMFGDEDNSDEVIETLVPDSFNDLVLFARGLQYAHDTSKSKKQMKANLEEFAKEYGVKIPDIT